MLKYAAVRFPIMQLVNSFWKWLFGGKLAIFLLVIVPIGLPHPHSHHDARKQLQAIK